VCAMVWVCGSICLCVCGSMYLCICVSMYTSVPVSVNTAGALLTQPRHKLAPPRQTRQPACALLFFSPP